MDLIFRQQERRLGYRYLFMGQCEGARLWGIAFCMGPYLP